MKLISILLLAFFAFVLLTYAQEEAEKAEKKTGEKIEATKDVEMAVCSGCDMKMDKAKMVKVEIDGKVKYFCSEECKKAHLEKKEGCKKEKKEIKKEECKKEKKEVKKEGCEKKKKEVEQEESKKEE